jgi:3-oxoacyl-[acyl-carrier-protein] synthase II
MKAALEDAGLTPADIDYVNVHGTSTPIGDPQEVKAIPMLLAMIFIDINISSTKSMTGHLLGAAGAVEAIASILAVKNDIIPPTINHFTDDPAFDPKINFTFNTAQKRDGNIGKAMDLGLVAIMLLLYLKNTKNNLVGCQ